MKPSRKASRYSQLSFGMTTRDVIASIRSQKLLKRSLRAKWIVPVIQGGRGKTSIFDAADVKKLWRRFKAKKFPPLLPCELRARKKLAQQVVEERSAA
jgi:hypothetical protein